MKGIFYNSKKSVCSIHESGLMCYNILKNSSKFILDYTEEQILKPDYDFAIINEHFVVNNWMKEDIKKKYEKPVFCIVTEVTVVDRNEDDPINRIPKYFDHYIVLDPTLKETDKMHGFGRPIEDYNLSTKDYNLSTKDYNLSTKDYNLSTKDYNLSTKDYLDIPIIGNNCNKIIRRVNNEDDPINIIPKYFYNYIVLDPILKETDKMHEFGRPNEDYDLSTKDNLDLPIIGSFGLPTPGKNWNEIIRCVNNDFDEAIIRFNIPYGDYINRNTQNNIINDIKINADRLITKSGIKFYLTHNNYSKEELIEWCASNTINCFFYDRVHINKTGLAAVTDQAISAGKPILVSGDPTFRHIHKYINHYPNIGIKQAITETKEGVLKMKDEWSSKNFLLKFENILLA